MNREIHVPLRESLKVRFLGATRPTSPEQAGPPHRFRWATIAYRLALGCSQASHAIEPAHCLASVKCYRLFRRRTIAPIKPRPASSMA